MYNLLNFEVVELLNDNYEVPGQDVLSYAYYTDDREIIFQIRNNCFKVGNSIYRVSNDYLVYKLEEPTSITYNFVTFSEKFDVYVMKDNEEILFGNFEGLSEYRFIEYFNEVNNQIKYILVGKYGNIRLDIYSEKVFKYQEKYYELLGEDKFEFEN